MGIHLLRRDNRPYFIKKAALRLQQLYVRRYLAPQFDTLGDGAAFFKPWHLRLFGSPIHLGRYATVIGASDGKVRLSAWRDLEHTGEIHIGDYALICPGVRISSAVTITIGHSVMLANGVYITDADWHGVYDRTAMGPAKPVVIGNNVWIGDGTVVTKGVSIGENSIIGAGTVVTRSVPANVIAAGNPAVVVKELDPYQPMVTRADWLADPARLYRQLDDIDRAMLSENTIWRWLKYLAAPGKDD